MSVPWINLNYIKIFKKIVFLPHEQHIQHPLETPISEMYLKEESLLNEKTVYNT